MTQTQACTHPRASVGLDAAYCPDCRQEFSQWSKEYKHLLNQDNSVFAASLAECPAYAAEGSQKPDSITCFESPNSLKQIHIEGPSSPDTTLAFPVTPTSEPSPQSEESSIAWQEDRRARELAEPIPPVRDLMTNAQDCGEKCGAVSATASLDLSSGKMSPLPDTQNQDNDCLPSEEFCGTLPASGIAANGSLWAQSSVERHTCANGCSLLPTPMAHSRARDKYRTPGQDKLEQKLRQLAAIPAGHVSHPALREWMQGLPAGWTAITELDGGLPTNFPPTSASLGAASSIEPAECKPSEIVAPQPKQPSLGEESPTLPDFFKPQKREWSDRAVDGKEIGTTTGTVTGNAVQSIQPDTNTDDPPIDTGLVKVRRDGNNFDNLIAPDQLLLKESPTMIVFAPTQTFDESVTLSSQNNIPGDSKAEVLTERKSQVPALEAELRLEPEPEFMPAETLKELASPTESNTTEFPEPLKQPEEEGNQSNDGTQIVAEHEGNSCEANQNEQVNYSLVAVQADCEIVKDFNELTELEQLELENCEQEIESGIKSFYKMGKALLVIREQRLYRKTHSTFADYCEDRWEIARSTAYQLIDAAVVVTNVRNCGQILPANEAQARPLVKLKKAEQQQQAWQKVVATAPGGKVTAEHVASVVREIEPLKQKKFPGKPQRGSSLIDASPDDNNDGETLQSQPNSVEDELSYKAEGLGLPTNGEQVLPSLPRNDSSPADVDDRPFATRLPVSISPDEICTTFISNIEYLNHEHLVATVDAITQRTSDQKLNLMIDEELRFLVNKFAHLLKRTKRLLNERCNPSYFNS